MKRTTAVFTVFGLLAFGACGGDDDAGSPEDDLSAYDDEYDDEYEYEDDEYDDEYEDDEYDDETADDGATEPAGAGSASPSDRTRDDVDCTEYGLAGDSEDRFVSAYYVVDGTLGQRCFGEENETLLASWQLLSSIVPTSELRPLSLFAGFDSPDSDTLAFVDAVGQFDGRVFLMALNLPLSDPDSSELVMTLAHEYSHVLTGDRSQLDRLSDPASCDTFYNGVGCAEPNSYLAGWVDAFWDADLLAGLDVNVDSADDAESRCELDPGFLGSYAATNPDEDLAESFAAYVFDVGVSGPTLERKVAFFDNYPELAAIRERAQQSGIVVNDYAFDRCG